MDEMCLYRVGVGRAALRRGAGLSCGPMASRWWGLIASALALGAACSPSAEPGGDSDAGPAARDAAPAPVDVPAAADVDSSVDLLEMDVTADPPPLVPFERVYSSAAGFAAPDGHRWVRSIVHLHSTHSHDACDSEPRPDGGYNLPCLASLRQALCTARVDVAWLTDHPTHAAEIPFVDALLYLEDEGDALVIDGGEPIANWITCAAGHRVLLRAGVEDELMPVGLRRHVAETPEARDLLLNAVTPEAVAAMKDAGALVFQAHTEQRPLELLRSMDLDGIEVYQLHANIDPDIREEHLGLDPLAPLVELTDFLFGSTEVHPDLSFLLFLDDNRPSLRRWANLCLDKHIVATAGTDAHENVLPRQAIDGERFDSYRRMISWFSNYVLVEGEVTPQSAQRALGAGRVFIGFDVLGDVAGFEAHLEVDGVRHEMGATVQEGAAASLHFEIPTLEGRGGQADLQGRVLRATPEGWEALEGTFGAGSHSVALEAAGAYRLEVRVTLAHLRPHLGRYYLSRQGATYPWIMTNAWRLGLP